jgi:hypothetical protein
MQSREASLTGEYSSSCCGGCDVDELRDSEFGEKRPTPFTLAPYARMTLFRQFLHPTHASMAGVSRAALDVLRAGALAVLLSLGGLGICVAQTDAQRAEYRVKAAFLYKFTEYIEWPDDSFARPQNTLEIGIIGADVLADDLAQMAAGHSVGGRPVTVRKLRPGEPVVGLHVLFVGRSQASALADLLVATKGRSVVTVTESDNALSLGSMINFVVVEDKVRFDIALQSVEQGNVKISARLLSVARKVTSKAS